MRDRSKDIVRRASTSSLRKAGARGSRSTRRIASTARRATSRTRPRTSTGSSRKAEEAPITRTCRVIAAALLIGTAAPALAAKGEGDALLAYARARAADVAGAKEGASRRYAAALT